MHTCMCECMYACPYSNDCGKSVCMYGMCVCSYNKTTLLTSCSSDVATAFTTRVDDRLHPKAYLRRSECGLCARDSANIRIRCHSVLKGPCSKGRHLHGNLGRRNFLHCLAGTHIPVRHTCVLVPLFEFL